MVIECDPGLKNNVALLNNGSAQARSGSLVQWHAAVNKPKLSQPGKADQSGPPEMSATSNPKSYTVKASPTTRRSVMSNRISSGDVHVYGVAPAGVRLPTPVPVNQRKAELSVKSCRMVHVLSSGSEVADAVAG